MLYVLRYAGRAGLRTTGLAIAAMLLGFGALSGCHSDAHPDDKAAVYHNLTQANLWSVTVDQDRGKGVIKLSGIVGSDQARTKAQAIAEAAAPGYTIQNNLTVKNTGLMKNADPKDTLDAGTATTMASH